MSPILGARGGLSASAYGFTSAVAPLTDYESIQTYTLTGNQTSVTFSGISGSYSHLQVRLMARGDSSGFNDTGVRVQLNSDTATNYSYHGLGGDGSSPYAFGSATQAFMDTGGVSAAAGLASSFGVQVIDLLDYANTNKYKTIRSLGGSDRNGNGTVYLQSGSWRNTNAVTAIKIYPGNSTNWVQYSSFALYGIK